MFCVYGLSRRSHKTAPKIGASNAVASSPIGISTNSRSRTSTTTSISTSTFSPNSAGLASASTAASSFEDMPLGTQDALQDLRGGSINFDVNPGSGGGNTLSSSMDLLHDFDTIAQQLNTYNDDKATPEYDFTDFGSIEGFSQPCDLNSSNMSPGFLHQSHPLSTSLLDTNTNTSPQTTPSGGCSCTSEVTNVLLSVPLSFQDKNASFDVQLYQLKRAIKLSADAIHCKCTSWDEMTTMTISILVGHIVQGFEVTLLKAFPVLVSSPDGNSVELQPNSGSPKLSWGVLQIESDDEDNLKQHLWLLHFRKLEAFLKEFSASIRLMRNVQGAKNSAHAMACECIHMWLEQRAQTVRDKFLTQEVAASSSRL